MVELIQGKYEKVKEYYGKKIGMDYFEFDFVYASTNETLREIDRFLWESRRHKTRFKNHYEGPALVDLTSWNGQDLNKYFNAFMYFLKDNKFIDSTFILQEECSPQLRRALESFFSIKITELELDKKIEPVRKIGFYQEEREIEDVRG